MHEVRKCLNCGSCLIEKDNCYQCTFCGSAFSRKDIESVKDKKLDVSGEMQFSG